MYNHIKTHRRKHKFLCVTGAFPGINVYVLWVAPFTICVDIHTVLTFDINIVSYLRLRSAVTIVLTQHGYMGDEPPREPERVLALCG